MTTLTTERLRELRGRLNGDCPHYTQYIYVRDFEDAVDEDAERDIVAALSRLIEVEVELAAIRAECGQLKSWQDSVRAEAHTRDLLKDDYLVKVKDELESRGWYPDSNGYPDCVDEASAAGADAIHQFINLKIRAEHLAAKLLEARKSAFEEAANYFDGTLGYNFFAADGYANAFDIASELRFMATQTPPPAQQEQQT